MNRKGQMPRIKPSLIIIIILLVLIGGSYIFTTISTAKKINNDLEGIRTTVDSVNTLLLQFQEFPEKIENINQKISNIESKLNQIEIDSNSLGVSEQELKRDLEYLSNIKQELDQIQKNLAELQKQYPPVQTQNIVFANATSEDVTKIVTNVINQRSNSLIISFAFGSIIGITIFQLVLF